MPAETLMQDVLAPLIRTSSVTRKACKVTGMQLQHMPRIRSAHAARGAKHLGRTKRCLSILFKVLTIWGADPGTISLI